MRTVRSDWANTLLVCKKCSKKLDGGFGPKGKTSLAKALRQDLGVRKGRKGADLKTNDVLFMLEAGTERRRAMPWMRPAFEAKKGEALQVFATELPRAIDRAVKKLAKRNGART